MTVGDRGPYTLRLVAFSFSDLFAGVGGFHAALGAMGGECWFASEIDGNAARVYDYNWMRPLRTTEATEREQERRTVRGDIVPLTANAMEVPPTDVLAAGFPCQPFSKSGAQQGFSDPTRGTLFWNIKRVIEERQPAVLLLENVRNLAGHDGGNTWRTIVATLRSLGYRTSDVPAVFSPHLLPPELGGRPQVRERVFVLAHRVDRNSPDGRHDGPIVVPRAEYGWDPQAWRLQKHLLLPDNEVDLDRYRLLPSELEIINAWDGLLGEVAERLEGDERLPGFPIWLDEFRTVAEAEDLVEAAELEDRPYPKWKASFLIKNARFYEQHQPVLDKWMPVIQAFPPSRRKFEWQAQSHRSLDETVMHFRPSGIRAKQQTYVPALVAITQTSIIGKQRRITPEEAAILQGLPRWFSFKHEVDDGNGNLTVVNQNDAATYKQMGNGVNVGAAYFVLRSYVREYADEIAQFAPNLVESVETSSDNPDDHLAQPLHQASPLPMAPQGSRRGTVLA